MDPLEVPPLATTAGARGPSLNGGNGTGPSRLPSTFCLDTSRTITAEHISRRFAHAALADDWEQMVQSAPLCSGSPGDVIKVRI